MGRLNVDSHLIVRLMSIEVYQCCKVFGMFTAELDQTILLSISFLLNTPIVILFYFKALVMGVMLLHELRGLTGDLFT